MVPDLTLKICCATIEYPSPLGQGIQLSDDFLALLEIGQAPPGEHVVILTRAAHVREKPAHSGGYVTMQLAQNMWRLLGDSPAE